MAAVCFDPAVRPYLIAGHRSVEAGHTTILQALDLNPLFDLGLRLGEGTGAALALTMPVSASFGRTGLSLFRKIDAMVLSKPCVG